MIYCQTTESSILPEEIPLKRKGLDINLNHKKNVFEVERGGSAMLLVSAMSFNRYKFLEETVVLKSYMKSPITSKVRAVLIVLKS